MRAFKALPALVLLSAASALVGLWAVLLVHAVFTEFTGG